ncbi:M56 family metallopeptidase [Candidatus Zixiibacteriota bacterium]
METWFNFISGLSYESVNLALNGLWLGIVLTGLLWLLWRIIKISNAATGYVVWWSVLTTVLTLPFLMGSPVANWFESRVAQPIPFESVTGLLLPTSPIGAEVNLVGPEMVKDATPSSMQRIHSQAIAAQAVTAAPYGTAAMADNVRAPEGKSIFPLLVKLLPISLFSIWLFVSSLLLLRLLLAHRRMALIKRESSPFDSSRFARLNQTIARATTIRSIEVKLSSAIDFPMAAGLGHPIVLLPRKLVQQLTDHELEAVILHELAHILRWDDWTKLGQKIIEALMFFNPAIRWIGRRLDLEREIACDDRVVEQLGRPGDYARCLTRLTQLTVMPAGASLIPGVLTSRKQIFQRFDRLLSKRPNGSTRFSRTRFIGAFAALVAALAITVRVAPVVAVPVEAVTFDELYSTVQAVTEGVLTDIFPAESENDGGSISVNSDLTADSGEPATVDDGDTFTLPITDSAPVLKDGGFTWAVETSGLRAAVDEPMEDEDDLVDTEIRADERVVDWSDEAFRLPITGTIHGIGDNDEAMDVWIDEDKEIRAAIQGRVKLSRDGRTIKSISKGGWLAVKEQHDTIWREVDVRPGDGDELVYAYYVDGTPREFDKNAREWFAGVLRDIFPEASPASGRSVSGIFEPVEPAEPAEPALLSELAQPAAPAEPLEPLDPPKPRIENRSLLSKIFDWSKDPFDKLGKGTLISTDDDGAWADICWSDGRDKMRIKMDGEMELTDDDRDIKSISRGGYFAVWEKRGSKRRELVVEPERNGVLNYGYYVDGKSRDFNDEAREWLADALPRMCRVAGINAESRAWRIYQREGVDGVLAEISRIESDFVKRKYFAALLDSDELSDDEYSAMLGRIGRELESDYEKAELLVDMADRVAQNKNLIRDYITAVETIESDHETRRVLAALSIEEHADDDIILAVLEIAAQIDSDYEKAELLIQMAPYCQDRGELQTAYVNAIINLESDYETRRVLSALSLDRDADPEIVIAVLQLAGQIDSDYEKAELLVELAPNCREDRKLQAAYVNSIINIGSDHETRRVLSALSEEGDIDPVVLTAILDIIGQMDSDYEKAELLVEIAARNRAYARAWDTYRAATSDGDDDYRLARQAYLRAVADMNTDHEIKRVLLELIDRDELNDALVLDILSVVGNISSDYDKSEILKQLVKYCRGKEDLEDAFLTIVDSMDSDYEANELYRLMYRNARRASGKD